MSSFKNEAKITHISFTTKTHNFCPLGNDWYTANLEVNFIPGDIIPDYLDVEEKIKKIDTKTLVIEDVVAEVYSVIEEYNVIDLKVVAKVDDAVHFPVIVTKHKEGK